MVISSSEPNALCFIETAELDGETNLKVRQALEETCELGDDINKLSSFNGMRLGRVDAFVYLTNCWIYLIAEIEYEAPNNNLGRFEGNLTWNNQTLPLKNDNVLLRGTRLRNTQWAFGSKWECGGTNGNRELRFSCLLRWS